MYVWKQWCLSSLDWPLTVTWSSSNISRAEGVSSSIPCHQWFGLFDNCTEMTRVLKYSETLKVTLKPTTTESVLLNVKARSTRGRVLCSENLQECRLFLLNAIRWRTRTCHTKKAKEVLSVFLEHFLDLFWFAEALNPSRLLLVLELSLQCWSWPQPYLSLSIFCTEMRMKGNQLLWCMM